jgi:Asp-tRNA(Asn)/Glu-tRNA(Gln) amidotransferase C subunit
VQQVNEISEASEEKLDFESLNLMRDDVAEELTLPAALLSQAPDKEGNFIKVKSILD